MIKFTGNIHMDMMCSCCTDKTTARHKINTAGMILRNIQNMVNQKELKPFMNTKEHSYYLSKLTNSHEHVHFMCGSCRQINISELTRLEREINDYLAILLLYIKSLDTKNTAINLKEDLFDLFRGRYPIAARLINDIEV